MAARLARWIAGVGVFGVVFRVIVSTEVLEGGRLELQCDFSGDVLYWERQNAAPTRTTVVQRTTNHSSPYACSGPFATKDGWCRSDILLDYKTGRLISIYSVQMDDAGVYMCITNNSESITAGMNVIVLGVSSPILDPYKGEYIIVPTSSGKYDVLPSQAVTLQCKATYSGFASPFLEMTQASSFGTRNLVERTRSTNSTTYVSRQVASISVNITPSEDENEFDVTCTVSNLAIAGVKDSKQFRVLYGPTFPDNIYQDIEQLSAGYIIISCEADSYPPAVYVWYYTSPLMTGGRNRLTTTTSWYKADKAGNFTCEARNEKLLKTVKKFFVVQDTSTKPGDPKATSYNGFLTLVAIAAAVLAGASIFVSMMVVMLKRRRATNILRQRRALRRARAASRSTPASVSTATISSTVATQSTSESPPEYSPPPMWDAPPSYDEATKNEVEMNYISGSS